jgi:TetR/AcrR family transcriptional regulator, transcriptional repressor for nem operon
VLIIREDGPEGVRVAEVMMRAGLTHGAFYTHFRSRDALLEAAIGAMLEGAAVIFERRADGLPPRDGLRAYIDYYMSTAHRDEREAGCHAALGERPAATAGRRARAFQPRDPEALRCLNRSLGRSGASHPPSPGRLSLVVDDRSRLPGPCPRPDAGVGRYPGPCA